jgi:hypothetical protein
LRQGHSPDWWSQRESSDRWKYRPSETTGMLMKGLIPFPVHQNQNIAILEYIYITPSTSGFLPLCPGCHSLKAIFTEVDVSASGWTHEMGTNLNFLKKYSPIKSICGWSGFSSLTRSVHHSLWKCEIDMEGEDRCSPKPCHDKFTIKPPSRGKPFQVLKIQLFEWFD